MGPHFSRGSLFQDNKCQGRYGHVKGSSSFLLAALFAVLFLVTPISLSLQGGKANLALKYQTAWALFACTSTADCDAEYGPLGAPAGSVPCVDGYCRASCYLVSNDCQNSDLVALGLTADLDACCVTMTNTEGGMNDVCMEKSNPNAPACNAVPEHCFNEMDDDLDGLVDCEDPDCDPFRVPGSYCFEYICDDGLDDDADDLIDCDDPDCYNTNACPAEFCNDLIDNDYDGLVDCDDPDCINDPVCVAGAVEDCTNGVDDNANGLVDCVDPDCSNYPDCAAELCSNGVDDDFDGWVDCDDDECTTNHNCIPEDDCANGIDDDGDGAIDCDDSECAGASDCIDEICQNYIDDDGDGDTDCFDSECQLTDPFCVASCNNQVGCQATNNTGDSCSSTTRGGSHEGACYAEDSSGNALSGSCDDGLGNNRCYCLGVEGFDLDGSCIGKATGDVCAINAGTVTDGVCNGTTCHFEGPHDFVLNGDACPCWDNGFLIANLAKVREAEAQGATTTISCTYSNPPNYCDPYIPQWVLSSSADQQVCLARATSTDGPTLVQTEISPTYNWCFGYVSEPNGAFGHNVAVRSKLTTAQISDCLALSAECYLNDNDGDGRFNCEDNCPNVANPDQADSDCDGAGDVCDTSGFYPHHPSVECILPDQSGGGGCNGDGTDSLPTTDEVTEETNHGHYLDRVVHALKTDGVSGRAFSDVVKSAALSKCEATKGSQ